MGDGGGDGGFALMEYVVPKTGNFSTTKFGTMPKAPTASGSLFAQVESNKVPGPEHYHKSPAAFGQKASGGSFSKLARQLGFSAPGKQGPPGPSAGQYDVNRSSTAKSSISFSMSKKDRGCAHIDMAVNQAKWKPSPGKYDGVRPEPHMKSPRFETPKSDARKQGGKPVPLGPGYYEPNLAMTEKCTPKTIWSKSNTQSFLDMHTKEKNNVPAPGHNGIPESKHEDKKGRQIHVARLLGDRIIDPATPRLDLEHC
jgi:hypothetical protein